MAMGRFLHSNFLFLDSWNENYVFPTFLTTTHNTLFTIIFNVADRKILDELITALSMMEETFWYGETRAQVSHSIFQPEFFRETFLIVLFT